MRVGVIGAGGRMGAEVCRAVARREGLELVAAVDPARAGAPVEEVAGVAAPGVVVASEVDALVEAGAEVVVDFSVADAARANLPRCAAAGLHAVVGTTGLGEEDLEALAGAFAGPAAGAPNCVLAANFAIGAVLMMRFAELAAPWFEGVEIVELHHDGKRDAPSGTAIQTAGRIGEARHAAGQPPYGPDRTERTVVPGARGGEASPGVRVHSVRLPGLVAHQEIVFGAAGQGLTIRHDSYDRVSFMDGVLLAVAEVPNRPGLTVGIEPLLGI